MEVNGGLYLVHVYLCLALLQLQLLVQPGHPLQELHHSTAALLAPRTSEIGHQLLERLVIAPDQQNTAVDRESVRLREGRIVREDQSWGSRHSNSLTHDNIYRSTI